jgi:hypothetical protein
LSNAYDNDVPLTAPKEQLDTEICFSSDDINDVFPERSDGTLNERFANEPSTSNAKYASCAITEFWKTSEGLDAVPVKDTAAPDPENVYACWMVVSPPT